MDVESFHMLLILNVMPYSYCRQNVPWLEGLLGSGTAPRSPHFVRAVHATGRGPLIGHGFLIINNSRMTVLQTLVTEKRPPLTLTHLQ